jgi:hypothetical protein
MQKVRVYKLIVEILDFEAPSSEFTTGQLEGILDKNNFSLKVIDSQSKVIHDWNDNSPLNQNATHKQAFEELFK